MNILTKLLSKVTIKKVKKNNLMKEVMEEPEKFMLEAFIENDEIVVKVKRKPS